MVEVTHLFELRIRVMERRDVGPVVEWVGLGYTDRICLTVDMGLERVSSFPLCRGTGPVAAMYKKKLSVDSTLW